MLVNANFSCYTSWYITIGVRSTPLLDDGLGNLVGLDLDSVANLLGDVHALIDGLQAGNDLGHWVAFLAGNQVAPLLGNILDKLKEE